MGSPDNEVYDSWRAARLFCSLCSRLPKCVQKAENTHLKLRTCCEHAYDAPSTVGPLACRLLTSAPAIAFAKSSRPGMGRSLPWDVPGPGQYLCEERYERGIKYAAATAHPLAALLCASLSVCRMVPVPLAKASTPKHCTFAETSIRSGDHGFPSSLLDAIWQCKV